MNKEDEDLLQEYVVFCTKKINDFLIAVKKSLPREVWTTDKNMPNKVLTTTAINGFIICLRKLIETRKSGDISFYERRLKGLQEFQFSDYHSSQYGDLGRTLYEKYFQ